MSHRIGGTDDIRIPTAICLGVLKSMIGTGTGTGIAIETETETEIEITTGGAVIGVVVVAVVEVEVEAEAGRDDRTFHISLYYALSAREITACGVLCIIFHNQ